MSSPFAATIVGKDGKEMVLIPAGEFLMGEEKRPVNAAAFYIDKYPVTNADYKKFVDATGYPPPMHWRRGTYPEGKANHPVVQVKWAEADAYAKWAGKRLPTEEEWEKAARGTDGRDYPWGNEWDKSRANTCETRIFDTTPVGQFSPQGDSPYGVADMGGNVWEWTGGTGGVMLQPLRGGTWDATHDTARCFSRLRYTPNRRNDYIGFRCAISATDRYSVPPLGGLSASSGGYYPVAEHS
jgi:formylglycine-generating enzyme required for sulfatase activity